MDIQVGEAGWRNEAFGESTKGKMHVFFHTTQVKHNFRTIQEKRPIFVEKIFITKLVPGDQNLKIDRPMREADMEEYPVEWARFEQKRENKVEGTPLDAWPILSDTQKAEFRALNIFTVDQFANLPDSTGARIMGFNDLRTKARGFLLASGDSALLDRVRQETAEKLAVQDAEMAALREQLKALLAAGAKPAKKGMTAEQREKAAERMRKMHADKKAAKEAEKVGE